MQSDILLPNEAESYCESLEFIELPHFVGEHWMRQHDYIEKLNLQAVICVTNGSSEFIKEFLINHSKIQVVIQDLIASECWRRYIFPKLVELNFEPPTTFPIYVVFYHEAILCNILETVMYHSDAWESIEDAALDLLDYAARQLVDLISQNKKDHNSLISLVKNSSSATSEDESLLNETIGQRDTLNFEIQMKCISLLRYISDNIQAMPVSVLTRMLNTHDIPVMLVQILQQAPWERQTDIKGRDSHKKERFENGKWKEISSSDSIVMSKLEGQIWLALYQLLLNKDSQRKYELNSYRVNTLIRLRAHLPETTIEQLPVLENLRRYLEHLSMNESSYSQSSMLISPSCLIIEQVPEIFEGLIKKYSDKWGSIAKQQANTVLTPSKEQMVEQAKKLSDVYDWDVLEKALDSESPPKCALCGNEASKRCSRCQNEWYCGRECQVKHWKKHKQACDLTVTKP